MITLWETYGSGMAEVAARVAAATGLAISDEAFSSEDIALARQAPDRNTGLAWILTLIDAGTQGTSEIAQAGAGEPGRTPSDAIAENTAYVLAAAERGGVILGRNGAFILRDRPNTLHVKLDGPREARIARAAESFRLTAEHAAARQRLEDEVRSRISVTLYGWNPLDNDHYDLVLNTALLGADTTARIIVAAAELKAASSANAAAAAPSSTTSAAASARRRAPKAQP